MVKIIKDKKNHFVNIDQSFARNDKLSWKARGIFLYLWSQNDEWDFYETEVVKHATDGLAALKSGLKELEKQGYLTRSRKRDDDGHFKGASWTLHEYPKQPTCENRTLENPMLEKPTCGNRPLSIINNKNYQPEVISTKRNIVGQEPDNSSEPLAKPSDKSDDIPYQEIVNFLNEQLGTEYHASSEKTRSLIRARWNEGFRINDFKQVILNKAAEWQSNAKMAKYLRPKTLFGTNFEAYLNQKRVEKNKLKPKRQYEDGLGW